MSRKSDIETAWKVFMMARATKCADDAMGDALRACHDLGRAAQAEKDAYTAATWFVDSCELRAYAKCLRAKVRKMLEGK